MIRNVVLVKLRAGQNPAEVADFKDAASYRAYDQDIEHNRARARLAPLAEEIARVQFQVS